ncbi:phosphatidate cytidylyltransferase [Mycoplasmopsis opalescens]|uniref:phosphatidate cytidylyltransferase n=1 Tax=Mycoplasmopsis opalescens TaxID=114886 RepID=UPI0004A7383C|nr:phosphatidate cytidylyltransferase [Mycoplasmopsis opalescens]
MTQANKNDLKQQKPEEKKYSFFVGRIIPAIVLALVTVGCLVFFSIFSADYKWVRIISYVWVSVLFGIFIFELLNAFRLPIYLSIVFGFLMAPLTVFPWGNTKLFYEDVKNITEVSDHIRIIASNPWIFMWIFGFAIIFFLTELALKRQNQWTDKLSRLIFVFLTSYILLISLKTLQLSVIKNWKLWFSVGIIAFTIDTFGLVGGKLFGKKWIKMPFVPHISPKKTWEGFIISVSLGIGATIGLVFGFNLFENSYALKVLFILLAPLSSVLGDLYFSYLKRINGVKDYSKILLDHGGFLDRWDSISFISFTLFILLIFN